MDWTSFEIDRFVKIMSLAMSGQGNEALVALRKATEMLERAGGNVHSLGQLLRGEASQAAPIAKEAEVIAPKKPQATGQLLERLARADLRLNELERENEVLTTQLNEAVRYIVTLEADLARLRRAAKGA